MNAMEKAACVEVAVTTAAVLAVAALYPWLGDGATGAFGLLGLLVLGWVFVRPRAGKTVVDERDRDIDLRANLLGVGAAWQLTFLTLIALVLWSAVYNDQVVPTRALTWLVWVQFVVCYWVKGVASLTWHRGARRAA